MRGQVGKSRRWVNCFSMSERFLHESASSFICDERGYWFENRIGLNDGLPFHIHLPLIGKILICED